MAQASLGNEQVEGQRIKFEQDIETAFYGARQFCILDPNGYERYFIQPAVE